MRVLAREVGVRYFFGLFKFESIYRHPAYTAYRLELAAIWQG